MELVHDGWSSASGLNVEDKFVLVLS